MIRSLDMLKTSLLALGLAGAGLPAAAAAQTIIAQAPLAGTRLDVSATGEVSRVPDVAIISAGVVTRAATATQALSQNAARIERVRAALARAGIAERDIQTSSVSLNPDYVYEERQPPRLSGYQASNQLSIRFRDIRNSGRILDALVAEGANQISGPTLTIDKPEAALDEARTRALAAGRARAELYARSLGMRVARLVAVSESASMRGPEIMVTGMRAQTADAVAKTEIVPGEQQLAVTLQMSFELQ
jgi:uncharacterized protein YggE